MHSIQVPGGWFTNILPALQNILSKFMYCKYHTSYENFKLKLCSCAQDHALDTRTKFQFEILTINVICGIVYFRNIILENSQNATETTPWSNHMPSKVCDEITIYSRTLMAAPLKFGNG